MSRFTCYLVLSCFFLTLILTSPLRAQWIEHPIDITGEVRNETSAIGDLDGNGFLDIVCRIYPGGIQGHHLQAILLGDNGVVENQYTFDIPYSVNTLKSIEIADVNSDGDNEVLLSFGGDYGDELDSHMIYLEVGGGDWGPIAMQSGPHYMIADDFDQDGDPDVIGHIDFRVEPTSAIRNVDGDFMPPIPMPNGLAIQGRTWESADFNLDGYPDVVGTSRDDQSILTVYLNVYSGGNGPLFTEIPIDGQTNAELISVADTDNDGDADVLLMQDGSLKWVENTGTLPWIDHPVEAQIGTANRFSGADFNLDGVGDVALGSSGDVRVWVSSDGSHEYEHLGVVGPLCILRAVDMNMDGRTDVLVSGATTTYWYENVYPPQNILQLTPVPDVDPYYIPAGGGTITMTVTVFWPFDLPPGTAEFELFATAPSGDQIGPLLDHTFAVEPGEQYQLHDVQLTVPATAPPGSYEIVGQLSAGLTLFTDGFTVVKLGADPEDVPPGTAGHAAMAVAAPAGFVRLTQVGKVYHTE